MPSRQLLRKVPEITAFFWLTKLLTTAMGEATSDFLVVKMNPYIAVILGGIVFMLVLILQFAVRKYIPWIYWLAVAMVAVFGTMAADVLHIELGVSYVASTIFFGIILVAVFVVWQKAEKTLSIHSITTSRRELFYWATVLATFALGTAAGDMTASTLRLGYLSSGIVFAVLIAVPAIAYWLFGMSEILAFWLAYILTRPLGASFADWMGKTHAAGGLGWGDGTVGIALATLIILSVSYMTFNQRERKQENVIHKIKSYGSQKRL